MMKVSFFVLLLIPALVSAQFNLGYRPQSVTVSENGQALAQATIGGFNTPQFSMMDLDGDGVQDLVVFDRSGNIVRTFLYSGSGSAYTYAPQHEKEFPAVAEGLMMLRDYNCDGLQDVFTFFQGGFRVFKNLGTYPLSWELASNQLQSDYGNFSTNILVLSGDVPAIVDVDNDGDLDILTFGNANSENTIEYHMNLSMDNYNSCDSLEYELVTQCWGNIQEPENSSNLEQVFCKGITGSGGIGGGGRDGLHPGSTVLLIDTDGDIDKDLIVGDIQTDRFVFAPNVGDLITASIDVNQQTTSFPSADPTRIEYMTSGYELDINQDGNADLIATVNNTIDSSCNTGHIWLYENSTSVGVDYSLVTKEFLLDEMIDLGDGSVPALIDINSDGLLDLVVASSFRKTPTGSRLGRLAYYRNNGTAATPSFVLEDGDFAGLSAFSFSGICPAFGNLDGDSDLEMILGDANGELHYFDNFPSNGVSNFTLTAPIYMGINTIGFRAAPEIVDLNGDGLNDLLVGEQTGILSYFENTGTSAAAAFASSPTVEQFGKIDVSYFCCSGYAVPRVMNDPSFGGGEYLFIGTDEKRVDIYALTGNLNDSLIRVDSLILNEGRIAPTFGDLTNDGNPDLLIGGRAGGLKYFTRADDYPVGVNTVASGLTEPRISVFPNPSNGRFHIQGNVEVNGVEFFDGQGRSVLTQRIAAGKEVSVHAEGLPAGMYFIQVTGKDFTHTTRVVIMN